MQQQEGKTLSFKLKFIMDNLTTTSFTFIYRNKNLFILGDISLCQPLEEKFFNIIGDIAFNEEKIYNRLQLIYGTSFNGAGPRTETIPELEMQDAAKFIFILAGMRGTGAIIQTCVQRRFISRNEIYSVDADIYLLGIGTHISNVHAEHNLRSNLVEHYKRKFLKSRSISDSRKQLLKLSQLVGQLSVQVSDIKYIGTWIRAHMPYYGDFDKIQKVIIEAETADQAREKLCQLLQDMVRHIDEYPYAMFDQLKAGRNMKARQMIANLYHGQQGDIPDQEWRCLREKYIECNNIADPLEKERALNKLKYSFLPIRWNRDDMLTKDALAISKNLPHSNETVTFQDALRDSERIMQDSVVFDHDTDTFMEDSTVIVCTWHDKSGQEEKPISNIWRPSDPLFDSLTDQIMIYINKGVPVKAGKRELSKAREVLNAGSDVSLEAKEYAGLILEDFQVIFEGAPGQIDKIYSLVSAGLKALKLIPMQPIWKRALLTHCLQRHFNRTTLDLEQIIHCNGSGSSDGCRNKLTECFNKLRECSAQADIFSNNVRQSLQEILATLPDLITMATEQMRPDWRHDLREIARRMDALVSPDASIRQPSAWKIPASDSEASATIKGVTWIHQDAVWEGLQ